MHRVWKRPKERCGPGGPWGSRDGAEGRPAPRRAPGAAYLALLDKAAGRLRRGPRLPICRPFSPSQRASAAFAPPGR